MKNKAKLICSPERYDSDFKLEVSQKMNLKSEEVYSAWTKNFDSWFAKPGTLIMDAKVNSVFFFETEFNGSRHPHYGRFLSLVPNERIELTWITEMGTRGAETVVKVNIEELNGGVNVKLSHSGLPDKDSQAGHKDAWISILGNFEQLLKESKI